MSAFMTTASAVPAAMTEPASSSLQCDHFHDTSYCILWILQPWS